MEKKITNDQNIKNLKKRKILRILIILFASVTIIFALLNLFSNVSIIFALVFFVITTILNRVRENTKIIKKDELADVREAINKSKKHKK